MGLIQDRYRIDAWKLGISCILLNRTTGTQVIGVIDTLFELWPDAESMSVAEEIEITTVVKSCGFYNRRAERIKRFSIDFVSGKEFESCFGIGEYAIDSYKIFVLGDTSVRPKDKELIKYLEDKRRE